MSQHRGRLTSRTIETAVIWMGAGGGRHLVQWGSCPGPVTPGKRNFRCKFLLSGAFSARKLTPAKVRNTTHFHSRLHYVHPARRSTKNRTTGVPARITTGRGQKTGRPCKNGTDDNPGFGVNQQFWILKPHYITVFRCSFRLP